MRTCALLCVLAAPAVAQDFYVDWVTACTDDGARLFAGAVRSLPVDERRHPDAGQYCIDRALELCRHAADKDDCAAAAQRKARE